MNGKRIVAGGVVAGLVMIFGEFAIEPFFGSFMEGFFKRLALPMPGESAMMVFATLLIVRGIASVWLYAAIRPRYAEGVRTAALAGVAVWGFSCLFPNVVLYAFGLYDTPTFAFVLAWPLVETVASTLAGAKVYREALPVAT